MQSPSHTIDGYGPQDVEEEVLLIVLVDGVENKVVDDEVYDWLVNLLDDVLLVDFAGLDGVPELLEWVGVLLVRDDERVLVPLDDDEERGLDWALELELRNDDDDSKVDVSVEIDDEDRGTDEDEDELNRVEDDDSQELAVTEVWDEINKEDDNSKVELDVADVAVLDWWLLELKIDNVGLVNAEEDTVLEDSFLELETE
jgi:hypothetical protein